MPALKRIQPDPDTITEEMTGEGERTGRAGDWPMPIASGPARIGVMALSASMSMSASALQRQAAYLKDLSACRASTEVIRCSNDHFWRSWRAVADEGNSFLQEIRGGYRSFTRDR